MLVVGTVVGIAAPAMAATTAVVTVTGTPAYIAITISPTTYTINSYTGGNSGMNINTTYYSNPLGGTTSPSATVVDGNISPSRTHQVLLRTTLAICQMVLAEVMQ